MQGRRAVWSGDTAWRDEAGFLYFAGRRDGMLKTSGYRVSPTEVEDPPACIPNSLCRNYVHVMLQRSLTLLIS